MTSPRTIAGRYEIVSRLQEGGMGTVFRARDIVLDRVVALKQLRQGFDSEELRERFTREARAAARLTHRNIVVIHDFGEFEGQPYLVMEFIDGHTLAHIVASRTTLALQAKLRIVDDLCQGLAFAHRREVVHRDVKPANVIVDRQGVAKVLDFGIARLGDSTMTQDGMLGTLSYMAPEQIAGRADKRSDIFAVGSIFYELLSYQHPFSGGVQDGIIDQILHRSPPPLAERCPGLDPAVAAIIERAMQKDPAARYQGLEELLKELDAVRRRVENDPDAGVAHEAPRPPVDKTIISPTPNKRRQVVARQRAERIGRYLKSAEAALARGDHSAAMEAAEQVLLIEPEHAQAISLSDAAHQQLDRAQADRWMVEARDELSRGDLTRAQALVEECLGLVPGFSGAQELAVDIRAAREHREEERRRAESIAHAIALARVRLGSGALDQAREVAEAAAALDPTREDVQEVLATIRQAVKDRVAATVEEAQRQFASGSHQEALGMLAGIAATDTSARGAYEDLQVELERLEKVRLEEAARELRRRRASNALESARDHLGGGNLKKAEELARRAMAVDPSLSAASDLIAEVEAARAAEESARATVSEAEREFARGAREQALARLGAHVPPHEAVAEALQRLEARHAELLRQEEEARRKAEAEARARKEEEARRKAEAEERARGEEEARRKAEAEARARKEEEARRKAEAEERARKQKEEEARHKAEAKERGREQKEEEEKARRAAAAATVVQEAEKTGVLPSLRVAVPSERPKAAAEQSAEAPARSRRTVVAVVTGLAVAAVLAIWLGIRTDPDEGTTQRAAADDFEGPVTFGPGGASSGDEPGISGSPPTTTEEPGSDAGPNTAQLPVTGNPPASSDYESTGPDAGSTAVGRAPAATEEATETELASTDAREPSGGDPAEPGGRQQAIRQVAGGTPPSPVPPEFPETSPDATPAPSPAAEEPEPPPGPSPEELIRQTLEQYVAAYRSLDVAAVQAVQPRVAAQALESTFEDLRALEVSISNVTFVDVSERAATVTFRMQQTATPRSGRERNITLGRTARLVNAGGVWQIESIE